MNTYPPNWRKASRTLRRVVPMCERCHSSEALTVHHKGLMWANGRPGSSLDKHDYRLDNLVVLCLACHRQVEQWRMFARWRWERSQRKKRAKHRALGVGTGLVIVRSME